MKEVTIRKRKLFLSERSAKVDLDLQYYFKEYAKDNTLYNIQIIASVVSGSLRKTKQDIAWYNPKWLKYIGYNTKRLLRILSVKEISELYYAVLLLEGKDLKKEEAEKKRKPNRETYQS